MVPHNDAKYDPYGPARFRLPKTRKPTQDTPGHEVSLAQPPLQKRAPALFCLVRSRTPSTPLAALGLGLARRKQPKLRV